MELKNRFTNLVKLLFIIEINIESKWQYLKESYSEEYRSYHNLTHLSELFKSFDTYKSVLEYPEEVAFAIFYHDIIYNIGDAKNEEKSGKEAVKVLEEMRVDEAVIYRIDQLILCTKSHEASTNDEQWMIDFDLGILGQPWEVYEWYSQRIRQEYKKIPGLLYRNGRKKVLKHFLDKEFIYKTDEFISLYEEKARKNLLQELQSL